MKHILKSYGRAVLVAILPLVSIGETRWYAYLGAAAIAILGPTIRAMDPTDPMFGRNA
jgi:hypothetical protein